MAELTGGAAVAALDLACRLPSVPCVLCRSWIAAICGPAQVFRMFQYLYRGRPQTHISGTGKAAPQTAHSHLHPEASVVDLRPPVQLIPIPLSRLRRRPPPLSPA
jgi:hypothetical protein